MSSSKLVFVVIGMFVVVGGVLSGCSKTADTPASSPAPGNNSAGTSGTMGSSSGTNGTNGRSLGEHMPGNGNGDMPGPGPNGDRGPNGMGGNMNGRPMSGGGMGGGK